MVDRTTMQRVSDPDFPTPGANATHAELELFKARLEIWVASHAQETAMAPAMAALLSGFAQTGLRSLYLVNGGGLVAVLALLGNVWGRPGAINLVSHLQPSAKMLAGGLVCVFLATASAYWSQLSFVDFRAKRWGWASGRWAQGVCITLCAVSLALFTVGVWSGVSAIAKRRPVQTVAHVAVWSTIKPGER